MAGKIRQQKSLFLGETARRRFRFGKAFSPGKRTGSAGEDKIAEFLSARGISFGKHGIISRGARIAAEERRAIILASCPAELFGLIEKRFPLGKIRPELFRYDFSVEGFSGGKRRRFCIEYLGLYNPRARVDRKTFRRRHVRQVAYYTFFKTPLKREVYRRAGIETIEILPGELGALGEKLAPVISLSQERATLAGWLPSPVSSGSGTR